MIHLFFCQKSLILQLASKIFGKILYLHFLHYNIIFILQVKIILHEATPSAIVFFLSAIKMILYGTKCILFLLYAYYVYF